jgi:hypothetical protein
MEKQKMTIAPLADPGPTPEDLANEDLQRPTSGHEARHAFWIKLGRLAAMLEQLQESLGFLHAYQRSAWFRQLPEDLQKALTEHAGVIENIVNID